MIGVALARVEDDRVIEDEMFLAGPLQVLWLKATTDGIMLNKLPKDVDLGEALEDVLTSSRPTRAIEVDSVETALAMLEKQTHGRPSVMEELEAML